MVPDRFGFPGYEEKETVKIHGEQKNVRFQQGRVVFLPRGPEPWPAPFVQTVLLLADIQDPMARDLL